MFSVHHTSSAKRRRRRSCWPCFEAIACRGHGSQVEGSPFQRGRGLTGDAPRYQFHIAETEVRDPPETRNARHCAPRSGPGWRPSCGPRISISCSCAMPPGGVRRPLRKSARFIGPVPAAKKSGSSRCCATSAAVSVVPRRSNHMDIFAVGADGVYTGWWDSAVGWGGWYPLGGGSGPGGDGGTSPGSNSPTSSTAAEGELSLASKRAAAAGPGFSHRRASLSDQIKDPAPVSGETFHARFLAGATFRERTL